MIGEEKPSLEELMHFGRKGMHWGQHMAAHPDYHSADQAADFANHGAGGVRRINNRLHKGQSLEQARSNEEVFVQRRKLAIAGAAIALTLLAKHGEDSMSSANAFIANKAATNREAANVISKTLAIGSKASKTPFAKASRKGVFKITTL